MNFFSLFLRVLNLIVGPIQISVKPLVPMIFFKGMMGLQVGMRYVRP